jgi:hypothetical protein
LSSARSAPLVIVTVATVLGAASLGATVISGSVGSPS